MIGVVSWFILPCVCLIGMHEIGYVGRVEVYEVQVHQAAAMEHQSVIGACAVCREMAWMSELCVGSDGYSTHHPGCELKWGGWKPVPPLQRILPEDGDECYIEYNGKAYDGFRVGELASKKVKFGYRRFRGQFEEFTQSEIGERVRFKSRSVGSVK